MPPTPPPKVASESSTENAWSMIMLVVLSLVLLIGLFSISGLFFWLMVKKDSKILELETQIATMQGMQAVAPKNMEGLEKQIADMQGELKSMRNELVSNRTPSEGVSTRTPQTKPTVATRTESPVPQSFFSQLDAQVVAVQKEYVQAKTTADKQDVEQQRRKQLQAWVAKQDGLIVEFDASVVDIVKHDEKQCWVHLTSPISDERKGETLYNYLWSPHQKHIEILENNDIRKTLSKGDVVKLTAKLETRRKPNPQIKDQDGFSIFGSWSCIRLMNDHRADFELFLKMEKLLKPKAN